MGLAVEDAVALLDRGEADGLGEMALAGPGRPEKQRVLALAMKRAVASSKTSGAVHLLVEVEVEAVEGACRRRGSRPACGGVRGAGPGGGAVRR